MSDEPESGVQTQWSADGQWWWDGEKWLAAAHADANALTTRPAAQQLSVPSGQQSKDEKKRAKDEAKRTEDEKKAADRKAKLDALARRRGKGPIEDGLPMEKLHGRAQKLLEQGLGKGEPVLGRINGIDDTQCLVLTDQRAIIIKVGWRSGQTLGGKVTSFEYRNISSVEVRASIITGTFEISSGGMQGSERSYYSANKGDGAWHAPNTIPISKQQQARFQQVATFIRERARLATQPVSQPVISTAPDIPDQLRKLAELKAQGILTDAEFDAKKTELLARL